MPRTLQVRRQRVLDHFKTQAEPVSSKEVARTLQVKEVSVRAAISWLVLGGFLKTTGTVTSLTRQKRKYKSKRYIWTGKTGDICVLHTKGGRCPADIERECWDSGVNDGFFLQELMRKMGRK